MHGYFYAKSLQLCPSLYDPMDCIASQASLSMGFSEQEYWSELPCSPPGDIPKPGIKPASLMSVALYCHSKFEWREFGWEGRLPFCELGDCWGKRWDYGWEYCLSWYMFLEKNVFSVFVRWSGLYQCWLDIVGWCCLSSSMSLLNLCIVFLPIYENLNNQYPHHHRQLTWSFYIL